MNRCAKATVLYADNFAAKNTRTSLLVAIDHTLDGAQPRQVIETY